MNDRTRSLICSSAIKSLAAAALASCSAINDVTPEHLGDTNVQLSPVVSSNNEPFSTPASDFLGSWEGAAEDPLALAADPGGVPPPYQFPSGSSRIRLEIVAIDSLGVEGKLVFGEGEPPAPALDPSLGFPIGVSYIDLLDYDPDNVMAWNTDQILPPTEGVEYPAFRLIVATELAPGGTWLDVADGVLKLSFHTTEVLRDWCLLQTPHENDRNGYDCNGGLVGFEQDGSCTLWPYAPPEGCAGQDCERDLGPIDCNKGYLCQYAHCACNATTCAVNATEGAEYRSRAELSLRRVGDELVGVVSNAIFMNQRGLGTPIGTIHFHHVE